MKELRELLPDFVLGTLANEEAERVQQAVRADPALQKECDQIAESLAAVSYAAPAVQPSETLRERLLGSARGGERFMPFVDKLASLVDLSVERAKRCLDTIDELAVWTPLSPEISLRMVAGGPATDGKVVALVRVEPGHAFPPHQHVGGERVLVLQGTTQNDGALHRAGDSFERAPRSAQGLLAVGERELVCALLAQDLAIEGHSLPDTAPDFN